MFHDDEFIKTLKSRKDCDVLEVNAGKYIFSLARIPSYVRC